jgi:Mrp family chromosome partitioning ATPase
LWAVIGRQDSSSFVLAPVRRTGPSNFLQNLGLTIAETGASILLVDANLREESHEMAGAADSKPGLARLLTDESLALDDAVQRGGVTGFDFISAGGICENPGRLMASTRMSDLLKAAKSEYEMIIISCAPARTAADASVLAGLTDGVVLTVEPGHWWQRQFTETLDLLRSSGAVVLGTVVTRRRSRRIQRPAPPAKTAKLHRS